MFYPHRIDNFVIQCCIINRSLGNIFDVQQLYTKLKLLLILFSHLPRELGEWEKAEESIAIVDNTDTIVERKLANNV